MISEEIAVWHARTIVRTHRYKASILGVANTFTAEDWIGILERSGGLCYYCAAFIGYNDLTVEHVVPMSLGGANAADNIVAACLKCNLIKGGARQTPQQVLAGVNRNPREYAALTILSATYRRLKVLAALSGETLVELIDRLATHEEQKQVKK